MKEISKSFRSYYKKGLMVLFLENYNPRRKVGENMKCLLWLNKCCKVKIISKHKWEELCEQLEEAVREKKKAEKEREKAREEASFALELAAEEEKKGDELRQRLKMLEEEVQKINIQLEVAKIELKNKKDIKKSKASVIIIGGSPQRRETVDRIKEEKKDYEFEWVPSEKSKGYHKGFLKRIQKKVKLADLVLLVKDYIGHGKLNAALEVCRGNGNYKLLQTLSYQALESALQ